MSDEPRCTAKAPAKGRGARCQWDSGHPGDHMSKGGYVWRNTEPIPTADAGVWVRAELVDALREAVGEVNTGARFVSALLVPANNLVDAVERSAAGEGEATPHRDWCKKPWKGYCTCYDGTACTICHEAPEDCEHQPTPAPVGEPRCRCGHPKVAHLTYLYRCFDCDCEAFDLPVPVSDEAEVAWEAWLSDPTGDSADGYLHGAFIAGFRAAREEDA